MQIWWRYTGNVFLGLQNTINFSKTTPYRSFVVENYHDAKQALK